MSLKKLGSYDLLRKIGQGGMGEVYRARDLRLERDIAVKILPDSVAKKPERRIRFEREAKTVAALSHPNIVTIHSVEDDDDTLFITMELVQGLTLDQLIPADGLPLEQFFDQAISLADAVSYAHRKGITHRDLKPGNIMIDDEGRLKVLDFGLAKLLQTETHEEAVTLEMADSVTGEGHVVGTAAYMSPEQAEGKPVDHRSDIFSLGIVLYEMATGKRPFQGDSQMSTISAIIREEPDSVTQLRQALPRHLGRIIRKCLQKRAERRYQSAVDLRNDLQELREELDSGEVEAVVGVAPGAPGGSSWLKPALAVAILALTAFGVYRILGGGKKDHGVSAPEAVTATLATTTGNVRAVSISPDGRYIAYSAREGDGQGLHVKQLATGSDVRILAPAANAIRFLRISLDGQHVYFEEGEPGAGSTSDFDIFQIPILGGTPRRVVENVKGDFALSPDGEKIAFYRQEGGKISLMVAAGDGSWERPVRASFNSSTAFSNGLAWSPNGDHILATRLIKDPGFTLLLVEIDASDGREIQAGTSRWTVIRGMEWLPDGRIIVAGLGGRQRFQDNLRFWQLFTLEDEAQVLFGDIAEYSGVSVDRSGNTLVSVATTSDQSIWVVPEMGGGSPRKIDYTSQVGNWFVQLAWMDAGILVEHREGEEMHIRCLSTDGTTSRLLTTEGPFNMGPAVSPRGGIAYFSNRSGSMKIYLADPSGADVRRLTDEDFEELFPAFNGTGDWVYYHVSEPTDERWALRKAPVSGGPSVFIADLLGFPRISPDGSRLLVSVLEPSCDPCAAILPIEGGEPEFLNLENTDWRPEWYPDASALTVRRHENEVGSVWVVPLDGSRPWQLARFPDETIHSMAWSPGGDSLAVATRRSSGDVVLLRNISGN